MSVCAHCQGVLVLLQGCDRRVRVIYVHRIAPALCVGQPQQQRMEALVELLHVCVCVWGVTTNQYYIFTSVPTSLYRLLSKYLTPELWNILIRKALMDTTGRRQLQQLHLILKNHFTQQQASDAFRESHDTISKHVLMALHINPQGS